MPTYTVRTVNRWTRRPEQKLTYLYEERITAWNPYSFEEAIELAERELAEYVADTDGEETLDLVQAYWLFDEIGVIAQGTEIFSLLRESDLDAQAYLDAFFDAGYEHEGKF